MSHVTRTRSNFSFRRTRGGIALLVLVALIVVIIMWMLAARQQGDQRQPGVNQPCCQVWQLPHFSVAQHVQLDPLILDVLNEQQAVQGPRSWLQRVFPGIIGTGHTTNPENKSFELVMLGIAQARWRSAEMAGLATPQPGSRVALHDGSTVAVPQQLPQGYTWQTIAVQGSDLKGLRFASFVSQSWAGGGAPLPAPTSMTTSYLIGGNAADELLVLAQFPLLPAPDRLMQPYHLLPSADGRIPMGVLMQPAAPASVPPQTNSQLVFPVGGTTLHETLVKDRPAWWYHGTWSDAGAWVDDATHTTVLWQDHGMVYQLTSHAVPLEELIRIAASVPEQ